MIGDIVAVRIAPEGWYAEFEIEGFAIGAVYDFGLAENTTPTELTPYFIVVSEGFDSAGQPVTVTRQIYATIQQRKAHPNDEQNQETVAGGRLRFEAVLSEFIYDDDKAGGPGTSGTDPVFHAPAGWVRSAGVPSAAVMAMPVENLSTYDYPVPVANWTLPDYERLKDYSVTVAAIGFHASGRDQRPLACMEFIATAGEHSASSMVGEAAIDPTQNDPHPVIEYVGTVDLTGFPDNTRVALNFRAYPIIGDLDSVYDSTAGSPTAAVNHHTLPQSFLLDVAGVRGYPVAVVDPVTGTVGGVVSDEDTELGRVAAAAAPFATLAQAMLALSAHLTATCGRSDLSGATVYLASGTHRLMGGNQAVDVPVLDGGCWLTITPLPGATPLLTTDSASNFLVPAHAIKFLGCTLERSANKPFAAGNDGLLLTQDCVIRDTRASTSTDGIFDDAGWAWHLRSTFRRVQVETASFRGCSFPEGNQIGRRRFIVGCDWVPYGDPPKLFASSSNATNTSDGMVMAYNAFWKCNEGAAEYPGVGEGDFQQGCAVVQNLFEQAAGDGNRLIRFAADGDHCSTRNCIIAHNTVVGELCNVFYNDERGPRHLHLGHMLVLNATRSLGSKTDTFAGDSRCTGNWPVYNGCGLIGNRVQGGNFPTRFRGLHSIAGEGDPGDATFIQPGFINDASGSGSELGFGNYRPAPGSLLVAVPGPQMLRWDLDGNERAVLDACGAYRYDPNVAPPATPALLRLTAGFELLAEDFEGTGEPAGWTHDSSGYQYDHIATPLRGAQSLLLTGGSGSDTVRGVYTPVLADFPNHGSVWFAYFILKVVTMPSGGVCPFFEIRRKLDDAVQHRLQVGTDGRITAHSALATGSTDFYQLSAGVETHLWLRRNEDGSLSCRAAANGTRPEEVIFSAPPALRGKAARVRFGASRGMHLLVDYLRIRTGEIGSDPV
ncbi:hypothetical protein OKA05_10635 [Luteolibacter arcticus]|uniref:Right-handed parallel beta-helix repeat-containing protein n=1 Tax=Luteolibacter arcticus TaxID=1581411 RepID=A0ABT3GHB0_9BACT|nr:hypothetical protein [Luteolibacter arcticus]MCW1923009.1 hypothetical protein [Luteolibacter arcticus]